MLVSHSPLSRLLCHLSPILLVYPVIARTSAAVCCTVSKVGKPPLVLVDSVITFLHVTGPILPMLATDISCDRLSLPKVDGLNGPIRPKVSAPGCKRLSHSRGGAAPRHRQRSHPRGGAAPRRSRRIIRHQMGIDGGKVVLESGLLKGIRPPPLLLLPPLINTFGDERAKSVRARRVK